jgi:eukaryotic-like serine/threonine-protein kinase
MALSAGTRFGPFEVVGPLGTGAMGEVYRARNTTLEREVALKILPTTFALDPDRVTRFQREARVLAALNHPHIGAILGIAESHDVRALVLELVEGPTLADRIARGPMALAEARHIARQICDALGAAHQRGIVHRDLKPANIKIRPDGVVKVLDFGLAKAAATSAIADDDPTGPTLMSPAMTEAGIIVGTPGYMSPEQAAGHPAHQGDDVWAFGSVFYEMLTGRRAFRGNDVGDTLAAVLSGSPDWASLPLDLPEGIRTLVKGCLERDSQKRIGDFAVAMFLLREPATDPSTDRVMQPLVTTQPPATPGAEARLRQGTLLICLAIAFGIIALRAPQTLFTPASLIVGALGAGNLIYYFIVRSRGRVRV